MSIKFYKTNAPYGFLNNFYHARFFIYGNWWNFVESAYQSKKTVNPAEKEQIWAAKTPREARDLGQKVAMYDLWEDDKIEVMYQCCLAKFTQNMNLMIRLLETGDEELIEDSPVDYFWGCGANGTGRNELGKVLMRIRKELRDGQETFNNLF